MIPSIDPERRLLPIGLSVFLNDKDAEEHRDACGDERAVIESLKAEVATNGFRRQDQCDEDRGVCGCQRVDSDLPLIGTRCHDE